MVSGCFDVLCFGFRIRFWTRRLRCWLCLSACPRPPTAAIWAIFYFLRSFWRAQRPSAIRTVFSDLRPCLRPPQPVMPCARNLRPPAAMPAGTWALESGTDARHIRLPRHHKPPCHLMWSVGVVSPCYGSSLNPAGVYHPQDPYGSYHWGCCCCCRPHALASGAAIGVNW